MPTIKTSDAKSLHYEDEGPKDAPPLLFSNSLGTNLHMWDAQAEAALSRGFRVIRYDQRGHGESDAPKGDYTMERLGKDILDLLDALKLESTAYCGLSMGGMAGIWVAMNRPRRFSRAVFANTAIHFQERDIWDGRIRTVTEKGMAAIVDAVAERWFTRGFPRRQRGGGGPGEGDDPLDRAGGLCRLRRRHPRHGHARPARPDRGAGAGRRRRQGPCDPA